MCRVDPKPTSQPHCKPWPDFPAFPKPSLRTLDLFPLLFFAVLMACFSPFLEMSGRLLLLPSSHLPPRNASSHHPPDAWSPRQWALPFLLHVILPYLSTPFTWATQGWPPSICWVTLGALLTL